MGLQPTAGSSFDPGWKVGPQKPNGKAKGGKRKLIIPQIVITRASQDTLQSYNSATNEEQRTIKEEAGWGPYCLHRNPSTVAAYGPHTPQ
ncbi:PREDICTED: spermatogenesis-associated protein 33 [Condylura cristata]|uniref:spermatogenesis-associated protein 33 n=1 Tax=Condylura cristata TaxID=143302 RepID=UPI000643C2E9|nr:PREDICTED: spermatogenesis-associated protein 33 [Condylura cristata]